MRLTSSPGSMTMASAACSSPSRVQLHCSGPTGKVSRIMDSIVMTIGGNQRSTVRVSWRERFAMRSLRLIVFAIPALVLVATSAVLTAESDWQKSYPVPGKPSLTVSTGDASTDVHSCGCREIRIRVEWNDRHPNDYTINEFQSGDHVNFELKEKEHFGIHVGMHREPHVTVETPGELDLEARTSDGSLKVYGVNGSIALHTSDGAVDVSDVSGAVRLVASDGSIRIHNVSGTLESKSSDGRVTIDGKLSG